MKKRRDKWDAVRLYEENTMEELAEMLRKESEDPKNQNPKDEEGHPIGTIYLLNKRGQKRTDAIGWAITYHLQDIKNQANNSKP